jgi:hypothetical protein
VKTCTVDGCGLPVSESQFICARCWNNLRPRLQKDYQEAVWRFNQTKAAMNGLLAVIQVHAAKALVKK